MAEGLFSQAPYVQSQLTGALGTLSECENVTLENNNLLVLKLNLTPWMISLSLKHRHC